MNRLLLIALLVLSPNWAVAGTVITSTVTYNGADVSGFAATALPEPGSYAFDLVVTATPTTSSNITSLIVYVQQQYVNGGEFLTIAGSTFTTCNAACSYSLWPGLYQGGNLRASWSVTSGSATIRVTARKVTP